jgi:hypothetical protein
MKTDYKLPDEYVQIGFHISRFGRESLALKHNDRTLFVFRSQADLRDELVSRLCDMYARRVLTPTK